MAETGNRGPRDVEITGGKGTVVGDYNTVFQYFGEAPRAIADAILSKSVQPLVEERTRHFVGRDFIFKSIDESLQDEDFDAGYIVIQGEPGIGKTAVLAQLIKTRGWIHHFNVASLGIRSPKVFLDNVSAQLVARYKLPYSALPPEAGRDGAFLAGLLTDVAGRSDTLPLVIAVDALDEAEDSNLKAGANRLFLPGSLLKGVYFVVTTRPQHDYHLAVDSRRDIYLRDDDPQNLADVQAYIREFFARGGEKFATQISAWGVSLDGFVEILTEKSEGNFMYLVHVLREIRNGTLTPATIERIESLPKGLSAYYLRHWNRMKSADPDRFHDYEQPVICLLATVREPVTIAQVVEWTRTVWSHSGRRAEEPVASIVVDVVREWREYLNSDDLAAETRYRVYHASFQDFLRKEVGLTMYDKAISDTALAKIPGFSQT
jgi:hypothetical protein